MNPTTLKTRSVRSGAATLTSKGIQLVIQIASTAILARLLTPEDYGMIAMVMAVAAFAGLFQNLGLSAATIQKPGITVDQLSTMFWINVSLGLAITIVVAALAPAVVWFYQKPDLLYVTIALSSIFFISSLGSQQSALLTRQMRFTAHAAVGICAMVVKLGASVAVALHGGRYWALVAGVLAESGASVIGLWLVSGWRPGWPVRGSGVRELLRFGANVTGFGIANYFHRNLDNVLIGRVWGSAQLGLYSKAYSLLMLPITNLRGPLNQVAFPVMSRLQDNPQRYRSYFVRYISILALLSMPLVGLLFVCSEDVIRLLLGPRWIGASEIFAILALGALIQPVASLRGLVLVSTGQGGRYLRWGVYNAVAATAAFTCGLPWGAKGVAIAYVITTYLILHPSVVYMSRATPLRPRDFYLGIARPFIATVMMCLGLALVRTSLPPLSSVAVLAICGSCAALIFVATFTALPGGRQALQEHVATAMLILGRDPQGRSQTNTSSPEGVSNDTVLDKEDSV